MSWRDYASKTTGQNTEKQPVGSTWRDAAYGKGQGAKVQEDLQTRYNTEKEERLKGNELERIAGVNTPVYTPGPTVQSGGMAKQQRLLDQMNEGSPLIQLTPQQQKELKLLTQDETPIINNPLIDRIDMKNNPAQYIKKDYSNPNPNSVTWGSVIKNSLGAGANLADEHLLNAARMFYKGVNNVLDAVTPDSLLDYKNNPLLKKMDEGVKYYENQSNNYSKNIENASGVQKAVGGAVQMLPELAMSAMGSGLMSKLGEANSVLNKMDSFKELAPFGTLAGAGYAREAENQGADYNHQMLYGIAGGLSESLTEKLPLDSLKNVISGKLINDGAKTLVGKYGKAGLTTALGIASEMAQEAAVDPLSGYAEKTYVNPNKPMYGTGGIFDLKQMGQDAVGGGVLGVLLGSLGLSASKFTRVKPLSTTMAENVLNNNIPATPEVIQAISDQYEKDLQQYHNDIVSLSQNNNAEINNPQGVNIPGIGQAKVVNDDGRNVTLHTEHGTVNIGKDTLNTLTQSVVNNPIDTTQNSPIEPTLSENSQGNINTPTEQNNASNSNKQGIKIISDEEIEKYLNSDNAQEVSQNKPIVPTVIETNQDNTNVPLEEKPSQNSNKEVLNDSYKVGDEVVFNHNGLTLGGTLKREVAKDMFEVEYEDNKGKHTRLIKVTDGKLQVTKSEPTSKEQLPMHDRDMSNVGSRKVKSYQYLHPELKTHIQGEANIMLGELNNSLKGQRSGINVNGENHNTSTQRITSQDIASLLDEKYAKSYDDIKNALESIIKDHGAENTALAKRLEVLIDNRLTNGYHDFITGHEVPKNEQYISEKETIEGKQAAHAAENIKNDSINSTEKGNTNIETNKVDEPLNGDDSMNTTDKEKEYQEKLKPLLDEKAKQEEYAKEKLRPLREKAKENISKINKQIAVLDNQYGKLKDLTKLGTPLTQLAKTIIYKDAVGDIPVDATIKVYRGTNSGDSIKNGDIVTTNKKYASQFGTNVLSSEIPIRNLIYLEGRLNKSKDSDYNYTTLIYSEKSFDIPKGKETVKNEENPNSELSNTIKDSGRLIHFESEEAKMLYQLKDSKTQISSQDSFKVRAKYDIDSHLLEYISRLYSDRVKKQFTESNGIVNAVSPKVVINEFKKAEEKKKQEEVDKILEKIKNENKKETKLELSVIKNNNASNVTNLGVKHQSKSKNIEDIFSEEQINTLNEFMKNHKFDAKEKKNLKKILTENTGNIHSVLINPQRSVFVFLNNAVEYESKKVNEFILQPSRFNNRIDSVYTQNKEAYSIDKLNINFEEEISNDFGNIQVINGTKVLFNNASSKELYNIEIPENQEDSDFLSKSRELLTDNNVPVSRLNIPVFIEEYQRFIVSTVYTNKKGINKAATPLEVYEAIKSLNKDKYYNGDYITNDYDEPNNPLHNFKNIIERYKITRPISKEELNLANEMHSEYLKELKDSSGDTETELDLQSKFIGKVASLFEKGIDKYNKEAKKGTFSVIKNDKPTEEPTKEEINQQNVSNDTIDTKTDTKTKENFTPDTKQTYDYKPGDEVRFSLDNPNRPEQPFNAESGKISKIENGNVYISHYGGGSYNNPGGFTEKSIPIEAFDKGIKNYDDTMIRLYKDKWKPQFNKIKKESEPEAKEKTPQTSKSLYDWERLGLKPFSEEAIRTANNNRGFTDYDYNQAFLESVKSQENSINDLLSKYEGKENYNQAKGMLDSALDSFIKKSYDKMNQIIHAEGSYVSKMVAGGSGYNSKKGNQVADRLEKLHGEYSEISDKFNNTFKEAKKLLETPEKEAKAQSKLERIKSAKPGDYVIDSIYGFGKVIKSNEKSISVQFDTFKEARPLSLIKDVVPRDKMFEIIKNTVEKGKRNKVPQNILDDFKEELNKPTVEVKPSKPETKTVEETKPAEKITSETVLKTIDKLNKSFRRGEPISLQEVKDIVNYILDNEGVIKAELSKHKNDELKKMIGDNRYTKKVDMVNHIYSSQLSRTYYDVADTDTLSMGFDSERHEDKLKRMIREKLNVLTQEKLDSALETNKKDYEERVARYKARVEGVKKPETMEDFRLAMQVRELTTEEKRQYDELKALKEKENAKKEETKVVKNLETSSDFTINKTKDTRDNRDLWVVKFKEKAEDFKSLNSQMKDLGGVGYSRFTGGFNFYFDPSEKLNALKNGEKVETTKEEVKPNKAKEQADKLRTVADNMQKTIADMYSERLENTARRARMAEGARSTGDYLTKIQTIMRNIADAIESEKVTHLDGISARTHIETLNSLVSQTYRDYIEKVSLEKYPVKLDKYNRDENQYARYEYEKSLRDKKPTIIETFDNMKYPTIIKYADSLAELTKQTASVEGTARLRAKIDKFRVQHAEKNGKINTSPITEYILELYEKGKKAEKINTNIWDYSVDTYKRLQAMGIKTPEQLRAALREYLQYKNIDVVSEEELKQREIRKQEKELASNKIDGFFPTPKSIVSDMLDKADIKPGENVLEPSAGAGHIADEIKNNYPDNNLDVVEWNNSLNNLLQSKGHNVIGDNALKVEGQYDKIIMNPPFEKNQDIDHVMYAYEHNLKPGGRIVAIMSEHPFFASDKKSVEFREFLDGVGYSEKLPEGSFKESDRSTGVNTRIVVIDKPETNGMDLQTFSDTPEDAFEPTKKIGPLPMNLNQLNNSREYKDAAAYLERKGLTPEEVAKNGITKEVFDSIPKEQRKFIANSLVNSLPIPEEMKSEFLNHPEWYEYIIVNNQQTMDNARKYVDLHFDTAVKELKQKSSLHNEVDTARAIEILRHYIENGEFQKANEWSRRIAAMGTNTGRAIQYFSVMKRYDASWTLNHIQKKIENNMSKSDKEKLSDKTTEITNKLNEVNSEAVSSIGDILKNTPIETMIDEGRKIKKKKSKEKADIETEQSSLLPKESKEEETPEERLAKKVVNYTKENENKEDDPITTMVNTLFKVAKEVMPEKTINFKTAKEFINEAMANAEEYSRVWNEAKEIVEDKVGDNPEAIDKLNEYFDTMLDRPFADKQLTQAVKDSIKELDIDLSKIVKEHYSKVNAAEESIKDVLINKGLDETAAEQLGFYISEKFNELTQSKKEQILSNIFRDRPKYDKKHWYKRVIELSNLGAFDNEAYRTLVAEKLNLPHLSDSDSKILVNMANRIQELPEGRERREAIGKMVQFMDSKLKKTVGMKVNAIQTMFMLLNSKTSLRNILSNIAFGGQTAVKNTIKTGLDAGIGAVTGKRTTTLPSPSSYLKGLREGTSEAVQDFIHNVNTQNVDTKLELRSGTTFTKGPLGFLERLTRLVLDDRPFKGAAIQAELKRAKILAEKNGEEFNEHDALEKAKLEANFVTFNDENKVSDALLGIKRLLNAKKSWGFGDMLLKFARTPANIFVREIQYSPYSLFESVIRASVEAFKDHKFDQEKFVESLSRGITGTAILGLGILLQKLGVVIINNETDKDKYTFDNQTGKGKFKVNFSALARIIHSGNFKKQELEEGDHLASYDWLVPFAANLTLGAVISEAIDRNSIKNASDMLSNYVESTVEGLNGLVEQPMLKGIQTFASSRNLMQGALDVVLSMPQTFVPSSFNQIRQLTNNKTRETYDPNMFNKTKNQVLNRIPYLESMLPQRVDSLGRPKETYQDSLNNFLNVFLNPSITTRYSVNDAEKVVENIFKYTGEKIQYPRVVDSKVDINSSLQLVLTPQEYIKYQTYVGQQTLKVLNTMTGLNEGEHTREEYENAAKYIQSEMTKINDNAKMGMLVDRKTPFVKKGNSIITDMNKVKK